MSFDAESNSLDKEMFNEGNDDTDDTETSGLGLDGQIDCQVNESQASK